MKNRLSSYTKTEVKYYVCCYGYMTSMREECSRLKVRKKKVMKTCGQRVWKYEETAEDCIKGSYMMCVFFNALLNCSNKGE